MSIEKTLEYIHKTKWLGSKPGLSRTKELLEKMGNPHKKLSFVHVAGTNGKGSTCSFIASCLEKAGYKTGLYTSPYINEFNERMRINGENISDEDLEALTEKIKPYADSLEDSPTEFEIITAIAFEYFAQKKCDVVVLEVGMGGELDSTNVIDEPICTVITSIGYDHTLQLGSTLSEIAKAKAGIIKGGTVVSYERGTEAYSVIESKCKETGAKLICADFSKIKNVRNGLDCITFDYDRFKDLEIGLVGVYQPFNAVVAINALLALKEKGYDKITDECILNGLKETLWQGRFEILGKEPTFILDGAHNPHGMKGALDSFKTLFKDKKIVFVVGAMADKDIDGMFSIIAPVADVFYTVKPDNDRAMSAHLLKEHIEALGAKACSAGSFEEAVRMAITKAGSTGVVAALGSLYFSKDIRMAYNKVIGERLENA